ncbi:MAG: hypothetical protein GX194_11095 [Clostridium sp.]|nr:hypothetical protein [Clostridium sp.]
MSLSSLKSELKEKKDELKKLEKRLKGLNTIWGNLRLSFDDDVQDFNMKITSSSEDLINGILNDNNVQTIAGYMKNDVEKTPEFDSDLSEAISSITSEINSCQRSIENLESDIRYLNREIEREKQEELKKLLEKVIK